MSYHHTQHAPLHYLLYPIAIAIFVGAEFIDGPPEAKYAMWLGGGLVVVIAFSFQRLTIEDQGDRLSIAFGPLPLFSKSVYYSDITAFEAAKSSVVDGWGIHWVPGRGWTYNLWGFDCVELRCGQKLIRIGTDDRDGLVAYLQERLGDLR